MSQDTARQAYGALKEHLGTVADLNAALAVLGWDQETYMPTGGAEGRAAQLATLARLSHEQFASPRTESLLAAAEPLADAVDPDSDEAALLRVTRRELTKATKLPAEFVAERERAASIATHVWQDARQRNDFAEFRPHLQRSFELARRQADYLGFRDHPYDALLDDSEPDLTAREVRTLFDRLLEGTLPLLRAIAAQPVRAGGDALDAAYAEAPQRAFGLRMARAFGYDLSRGRLDVSAHPFCTGFDLGDVRITTRFRPSGLGAVFGIFHECGHALYDQGFAASLARTPLADGAGMGIHESQSRMWENLVGRSRPFWNYAFPLLRDACPAQLGAVPVDAFYRGINRVRPTLIRIHADEVTYNLHIILRFELEMAALTGDLHAVDLPEAWNEKMTSYLGVAPPTDSDGVMQDTHWASGLVGYFPSYTIGNVASVQLFDTARREHPDLAEQFGRGEFDTLLAWMRAHVHRYGRKLTPRELLIRATGSPLTPEPYLAYLKNKFGELYAIG
jgi:carboxypeptidase Taq